MQFGPTGSRPSSVSICFHLWFQRLGRRRAPNNGEASPPRIWPPGLVAGRDAIRDDGRRGPHAERRVDERRAGHRQPSARAVALAREGARPPAREARAAHPPGRLLPREGEAAPLALRVAGTSLRQAVQYQEAGVHAHSRAPPRTPRRPRCRPRDGRLDPPLRPRARGVRRGRLHAARPLAARDVGPAREVR